MSSVLSVPGQSGAGPFPPPARRGPEPVSGSSEPADELVERARRGDVRAFEGLYRRHVGRVYAVCLRIHGDEGRAEEATQEAFVRAWQRVAGFEGRSAFSTWLYRLAVNVCLDGIRSKNRESIFEVLEESDLDTHPAGRSNEVGPETKLDLERAIRQLPPGARTAFVLHDIEGYRHREIAEMTGLAEGTWKAQLHRARRLLRERLER